MQVKNLSTNGVGGNRHAQIGFNPREQGTFAHFVRDWVGARVCLSVLRSVCTRIYIYIYIYIFIYS
jgi:hypothetical protein